MSTSSKLRQIAKMLPFFPRQDEKIKLIATYETVTGESLLNVFPNAKDSDGNPVLKDESYRRPIVACTNHYENMKKIHKEKGDAGVYEYCQMVDAYNKKSLEEKQKEQFDLLKRLID